MDTILWLFQLFIYLALFLAIVAGAMMINPMFGIIVFLFAAANVIEVIRA